MERGLLKWLFNRWCCGGSCWDLKEEQVGRGGWSKLPCEEQNKADQQGDLHTGQQPKALVYIWVVSAPAVGPLRLELEEEASMEPDACKHLQVCVCV